MSNNIILGSGVIGLLARHILGPSWTIIPFGKSRYYSFNPALEDNHIVATDQTESLLKQLCLPAEYETHKTVIDVDGEFIHGDLSSGYTPLIEKLYGDSPAPPVGKIIQPVTFVHRTKVNRLYKELYNRYIEEIELSHWKDYKKLSLNPFKRVIKHGAEEYHYDKIVSTIPLNALGVSSGDEDLDFRDIYYYHIMSKRICLEGADTAYVATPHIEFFKVSEVEKDHYVFSSFNNIPDPAFYFGLFTDNNLKVVNKARIKEAFPIGDIDTDAFETAGIYCVGSNAQWDYWMCVSSCLKKLKRIENDLKTRI